MTIDITGGQSCVDNPDVNQPGIRSTNIDGGRQVIIPNATFKCNGRISRIAVSMEPLGTPTNNYPEIQIWRPSSPGIYNRVAQEQLGFGNKSGSSVIYYIINKPINSLIEFQIGDVIGYYEPLSPRRLISSIQSSGYTSYIKNNLNSPSNTIDINNVDHVETDRQPLIELYFGKYASKLKHELFCMADYMH